MIKYRYLLIVVLSILLCNCTKEDDIYAPIEVNKYKLSDSPDGELQKYIYDFQKKYNSLIIVNPDSTDYKYNFTSTNTVDVTPALAKNLYKDDITDEENATLLYGVKFLDEIFFSAYSEDFKSKYLPVTILLGNKIEERYLQGTVTKTRESNAYASYNLIAVSKIDKNLESITEEEKQVFKNELHASYWYSYLYSSRDFLKIPDAFYAPSEDFYGKMEWMPSPMSDLTMLYEQGFIDVDPYWWVPSSYYEPAFYPGKVQDVKLYIDYIFSHKKNRF